MKQISLGNGLRSLLLPSRSNWTGMRRARPHVVSAHTSSSDKQVPEVTHPGEGVFDSAFGAAAVGV